MGGAVPIFSFVAPIVSAIFRPSPPSPPPMPQIPTFTPPPPAPEAEDAQIQEKTKDERLRRAKAAGLKSTRKTGGQGVAEDALVKNKTLLGE